MTGGKKKKKQDQKKKNKNKIKHVLDRPRDLWFDLF